MPLNHKLGLAVASQRCGSWEARRVLHPILVFQKDYYEWLRVQEESGYQDQDAKSSTVQLLFDDLQGGKTVKEEDPC